MSQYPSPYSPPPYSQGPGYYSAYGVDPLSKAKRAGLLMIIVGSIAILFALCMVGIGQMIKTASFPPEVAAQMQQMESKGVSPVMVFSILGGAFLLFAIVEIVLGVFVRTGSSIAIIFSLIGTSVVVLVFAFFVLVGAVNSLSHNSPQVMVGLVIWMVPLALLILQLIWLISAMRNRSQLAFAQQQYQAQYWQYQQNMQAYGYGQPPPPLPPKTAENAEQ